MTKFTDPLGREFIALSTLSTLLSLSTKQIHRHIRDKRLLSIKQGQKRFISKNDILREYPSLTPSMLDRDIAGIEKDILDTNETSEYSSDVLNVPDVPSVQKGAELNVYSPDKKQDLLIQNIEQVRNVVSRLEKSIANIDYIQRDTKMIARRLDSTNAKNNKIERQLANLGVAMSRLERQIGRKGHLVGFVVLALITAALLTGGVFGAAKFREFYQKTQAEYENLLEVKDTQINSLENKLNDTILADTIQMGKKDLEIERLRNANKYMVDTTADPQETKIRRKGGY